MVVEDETNGQTRAPIPRREWATRQSGSSLGVYTASPDQGASADEQYWLVIASLAGSGWYTAQLIEAFAVHFGDFANVDIRTKCSYQML